MVLSGKTSRLASLVNQTNTEGGVKKAGTACSRIGVLSSVGMVYRRRLGCNKCEVKCPFIISMTKTCGGGIGRTGARPRC
jgi:hypothetical protein